MDLRVLNSVDEDLNLCAQGAVVGSHEVEPLARLHCALENDLVVLLLLDLNPGIDDRALVLEGERGHFALALTAVVIVVRHERTEGATIATVAIDDEEITGEQTRPDLYRAAGMDLRVFDIVDEDLDLGSQRIVVGADEAKNLSRQHRALEYGLVVFFLFHSDPGVHNSA